MELKLLVRTNDHQQWPARQMGDKTRQAGEAFELICSDMSQPPQHRMTEDVRIRLEGDDIQKYFDKSTDKVITVACRRFVQSASGKSSLVGKVLSIDK